jgi:hypothetical protein
MKLRNVPYRAIHQELAALLRGTQGKFLHTYNDHPNIWRRYVGFKVSKVMTRLNTDEMATASHRTFPQLIRRNYGG